MLRLWLLLLLLTAPSFCFAADNWNFSGFATLAANKLNRANLNLGEATDQWDVDNDSKLGLQLQGDLYERLSFTTQIISTGIEFYGKDAYEPQLRWLFLSYQVSPNIRARAGRMRASNYIYSETQDIGYSYTWIRPPIEVYPYAYKPVSDMDGVDLTYTADLGDWFELDSHFFLGHREGEISDSLRAELSPSFGGNFTLRGRNLLLRYSLHSSTIDIELAELVPLANALDQTAAATGDATFRRLANSLSTKNERYIYHGFGVQWDHHNWSTVAETYIVDSSDSEYANDSDGWYVSLAYHWKQFTPYLVVAQYRDSANDYLKPVLESAQSSYGSNPALSELLARVDTVYQLLKNKQRSYSAGVRWDFATNLALTSEVQYFDFLGGTSGQSVGSASPQPTNLTLLNIALDWVF